MTRDIAGFEVFTHSYNGRSHPVYAAGEGAAIVLIHELPHISEAVVTLARRLCEADFRVYMPSLVGKPLENANWFDRIATLADLCVSREFNAMFSSGDAKVTDWLRSLVRAVEGGAEGKVGVMGLCFSGGFALAAATESSVRAAVACEPSLPFADKADPGIDDIGEVAARLRADELAIRVFRFQGDPVSPCERIRSIGKRLGEGAPANSFESRCLNDSTANPSYKKYPSPHSVVTSHLIDAAGEPTRQILDHIIAFFEWRLHDGAMPALSIGKAINCCRMGCAKGHWKAQA